MGSHNTFGVIYLSGIILAKGGGGFRHFSVSDFLCDFSVSRSSKQASMQHELSSICGREGIL